MQTSTNQKSDFLNSIFLNHQKKPTNICDNLTRPYYGNILKSLIDTYPKEPSRSVKVL